MALCLTQIYKILLWLIIETQGDFYFSFLVHYQLVPLVLTPPLGSTASSQGKCNWLYFIQLALHFICPLTLLTPDDFVIVIKLFSELGGNSNSDLPHFLEDVADIHPPSYSFSTYNANSFNIVLNWAACSGFLHVERAFSVPFDTLQSLWPWFGGEPSPSS